MTLILASAFSESNNRFSGLRSLKNMNHFFNDEFTYGQYFFHDNILLQIKFTSYNQQPFSQKKI
jgi:hypothetical protein